MNLKKRGLGRGLEALLVDVSTHPQEEKPQPEILPIGTAPRDNPVINADALRQEADAATAMDEREALAMALMETVQSESRNLLQEAEALKKLFDEFESMVRRL
jgi:ParB family chromosome partitioning protein